MRELRSYLEPPENKEIFQNLCLVSQNNARFFTC